MTFSLHGVSASKGIAIGRVRVLERAHFELREYHIAAHQVDDEIARYAAAVESVRQHLVSVHEQLPTELGTQVAAFIEVHLLMLSDDTLADEPKKYIRDSLCNAEWALKQQRDRLVSAFDAIDDPYLRTRRDDVEQVVNRILRALHSEQREAGHDPSRFSGRVVFADDLTPADTVQMQHDGILAFLTEFGGPNSHTAILARSLRIPAVVGLHRGPQYLRDDDLVIVDGLHGVVIVAPDDRALRYYRSRQREIARRHTERRKLLKAPAVTRDGERVSLMANVELDQDVHAASRVGADGIGLYRTEFLFMNRPQPPDEQEQFENYRDVVTAMGGKPVTIRTLDLGADKTVDGVRPGAPAAANPALGLRAVRLCLREVELFKPQLRAILRAAAHGPVRVMVPMVAALDEMAQVRSMLDDCRVELAAEGQTVGEVLALGAMIEVPAAAVCADLFARHLDFMSIGTNDLIQYALAIDRIDDEVNYLYDPLHPAVLRLIQTVIRSGQHADVPVAMCGEMAGDARYTRLLLGLGLREFSVHPAALLEVKQVIVNSNLTELKRQVQRVMRASRSANRLKLLEALG
ncbi:MAG: phosphoenolpyruvate--protein phosphotransferase [Pseudomonadota bacterium]